MGGDQSKCRYCGGPLPLDARFCPRCGLPVGATLDDSLGLGPALSAEVTAVGPVMERSRRLVIMGAAVGALALAWSIISSAGSGSTESVGSSTTEATIAVSTSTTVLVTTTAIIAPGLEFTVGKPEVTTTRDSTRPASIYVNGVGGPVLGDGVEGVLLGTAHLSLTLIDLATGEITFIPHGLPNRGEIVAVVGDEVLFVNARLVRTINLSTGAESDLMLWGEPDGIDTWIAGSGGTDSVWVVTEHQPTSALTVSQVDFAGHIVQSFEFEAPFWVRSANGTNVYLEGPGGSWIFDTVTSSVTALNGEIIETNSDAVVLLSCESTLECQVSIDTGAGLAPTSALTAADVADRGLHIAPDFTRALVHHYLDYGVEFTYVDLDTGDRVELGQLSIDAYRGIIWIPDTPWIIAAVDDEDLIAVNIETGAVVEFDLPDRGPEYGDEGLDLFGLIPTT